MERLTKRLPDGKVVTDCDSCEQKKDKQCTFSECRASLIKRLAAYEDTGWTPEMLHKLGENAGHMWDFAQAAGNMTVGRLKELAEADKDGRVVVLPCKVGDVLYAAESAPVIPLHVMEVAIYLALEGEDGGDYERISNIGKTVFLTREEAERAMQEMEGKKDGNETSM